MSRSFSNKGQRPETRLKYHQAIIACDSEEYIHLNISQIAAIFHLSGPALANQLRTHYPDVIPRREAERQRLGIADNIPRGARHISAETYAEAINLLRQSDITLQEAAERCNVSFSGLRQHIIFYHKDLASLREEKRIQGMARPMTGEIAGNGQIRRMSTEIERKYAEGVRLYRTTALPVTEIALRTGVNVSAFRHHLNIWHKRLMFERRGAQLPDDASDRESFGDTKRYRKSTAAKYTEAIAVLKCSDLSVETVARKFGFIPEAFRAYLKEHEPALSESLGMMTLPNGRLVLRRTYEKYREALEAYALTPEPLKSIAARLGTDYKSIGGFIRRSMPELLEQHRYIIRRGSSGDKDL